VHAANWYGARQALESFENFSLDPNPWAGMKSRFAQQGHGGGGRARFQLRFSLGLPDAQDRSQR